MELKAVLIVRKSKKGNLYGQINIYDGELFINKYFLTRIELELFINKYPQLKTEAEAK